MLRYTESGMPVYRAGLVPPHLATRRQLRADRLSEAGLQPAAFLHYNPLHGVCPLYERKQARPIRQLTVRQHAVLAAGRLIAQCRIEEER
ncbi:MULTISPECIES: hypothetical protein [unclassified Streptomyces]|uniref:hypothetical protein n=1 Tax=unclassified Streptomyces TaxID=2593676 RepID=UPI0035D604E0